MGVLRIYHSKKSRLQILRLLCVGVSLIVLVLWANASSTSRASDPEMVSADDLIPVSESARCKFPQKFFSPDAQFLSGDDIKYDRRLLPGLYLELINDELKKKNTLDENFTLPFNWNMLTNAVGQLWSNELYKSGGITSELNCEKLKSMSGYHLLHCTDIESKDSALKDSYGLSFELSSFVYAKMENVDLIRLIGVLHRLTAFSLPNKLIFLGIMKDSSAALIAPVSKQDDGNHQILRNNFDPTASGIHALSRNVIESLSPKTNLAEAFARGISVFEAKYRLNQLLSVYDIPAKFFPITEDLHQDFTNPVILQHSLFDWSLEDEKNKLSASDEALAQSFKKSSDPSIVQPKYFGEAYWKEALGKSMHYDWRFFDGLTEQDTPSHLATLHRLTRAWFSFCRSFDVHSWISHGSVIGFYFSGYNLPFDNDIDVQLPIQSLFKLAREVNNSIVFDMSEPAYKDESKGIDSVAEMGYRSYYLDINPAFGDRTSYKSQKNRIDARFIDVTTGQYIDITALASFNSHSGHDQSMPSASELIGKFNGAQKASVMKMMKYDEFFNGIELLPELQSDSVQVRKSNIEQKAEALTQEFLLTDKLDESLSGLVHCKDYHFYKIEELSPLLPMQFENFPVYFPSSWVKDAIIEYGSQVFTNREYKGYFFHKELNMWTSETECHKDSTGDACLEASPSVRAEYSNMYSYSKQHNEYLTTVFPAGLLNNPRTAPSELLAFQYYDEGKFRGGVNAFDGKLLRPEPVIAEKTA